MRTRRIAALMAAPALAVGLATAITPAAAAQNVTSDVQIDRACIGVPYPNLFGLGQNESATTETMEITAPERVDPGTTFTVRMHPGQMSIDRATSRMTYDFQIPDGAELTNFRIVPNTAQGIAGNPQLTQVDGSYLRLGADGVTIHDRPTWFPGGLSTPWNDGIRAGEGQTFRLPAVEMTLQAPNTDGVVTTGVRTGPAAPVESTDISMGYLTAYGTATQWGLSGTIGHANHCVVTGQARGGLTTTNVHSVFATETAIDMELEALTGDEVLMTASVEPNPSGGVVEFYNDGVLIGESEVTADGTAEFVWQFRDPGTHSITARYVGTPQYLASDSEERDVTVTVPGEVIIEPEPEDPPVDPLPEEPEDGLSASLANLFGS